MAPSSTALWRLSSFLDVRTLSCTPCSLAYLVLDIPLLLLLPDCNHVGGNAGYVVFLVVLTEVRTLHEARVSLTFACS